MTPEQISQLFIMVSVNLGLTIALCIIEFVKIGERE